MSTPSTTLPRRKLPIGIQTFAKLREEGCYYVDKTSLVVDLIESGTAYFLSRPRRFGKSLLIDTFQELFEGHRALFDGLAAESRWDWTQRYPVIRISFSDGVLQSRAELDQRIFEILQDNQRRLGVSCQHQSISGQLAELIELTHARHGAPAVVLIDEYDKPILDNITDADVALAMREGLKNLYSVLKGADAHLKFVFLTGVTKFSKVSLFSGLNNLIDITLDPAYSALCGYTDADVDTVFAPELPGLDRAQIRRWYNGYNWLGEGVYNPFDVLLLFRNRSFRPYWFETGTPTFLVKLLAEQQFFTPDLSQLHSDQALLSSFDVDHIAPEALLFQTGYLTLHGVSPSSAEEEPVYTLGYPNREVEASLNRALLAGYGVPERQVLNSRLRLLDCLKAHDLPALQALFQAFFASIPHDWYRRNELAGFEGYYASIFYSHFAALGLDVRVEDSTNHGRIDMTLLFQGAVYLFEFKVVEAASKGQALQQIKAKGYADKYGARAEPIHLIGVEFSKAGRNVVGFEVATLAG
ncbi:MAG: ATP-binding protein [Leptothrix sp. (in: b-proteobacteria)]